MTSARNVGIGNSFQEMIKPERKKRPDKKIIYSHLHSVTIKRLYAFSNPLIPRLSISSNLAPLSTPRALSPQKSYIIYSHIAVTRVRRHVEKNIFLWLSLIYYQLIIPNTFSINTFESSGSN